MKILVDAGLLLSQGSESHTIGEASASQDFMGMVIRLGVYNSSRAFLASVAVRPSVVAHLGVSWSFRPMRAYSCPEAWSLMLLEVHRSIRLYGYGDPAWGA